MNRQPDLIAHPPPESSHESPRAPAEAAQRDAAPEADPERSSQRQYIIPYKLFCGGMVPNWLMERKEVSPGAKLLWARLAQYGGEDGECYPRQETLGRELGVTSRTVREWCQELVEYGLIEKRQRGLTRPNVYVFPAHPWMNWAKHARPDANAGPSGPDRKTRSGQDRKHRSGPERKAISGPDRSERSGPIEDEENPIRESEKENTAAQARATEGVAIEQAALAAAAASSLSAAGAESPSPAPRPEADPTAVGILVEASFDRADAEEQLRLMGGRTAAECRAAVVHVCRRKSTGKVRDFRGAILDRLRKRYPPEPTPALPKDRRASAGLESRANLERVAADRRELEARRAAAAEARRSLAALTEREFEQLAEHVAQAHPAGPEFYRRHVVGKGPDEVSDELALKMTEALAQWQTATSAREPDLGGGAPGSGCAA